ncbi:MAG: NosD domain-containing protein, partial [Archaeoglobaceae archaeon]
MKSCIISGNNHFGIYLNSSGNNLIENNMILGNKHFIYLWSSNGNVIKNNEISYNDYGIYLHSSSDNLIYNNIFNNTRNFYIYDSQNTWNTTLQQGTNILGGNWLGGNAWLSPDGTGYSQTCIDKKEPIGICDEPYQLAENNIDYLPLSVTQTPTTQLSFCVKLNHIEPNYIISPIIFAEVEISNQSFSKTELTNASGIACFSLYPGKYYLKVKNLGEIDLGEIKVEKNETKEFPLNFDQLNILGFCWFDKEPCPYEENYQSEILLKYGSRIEKIVDPSVYIPCNRSYELIVKGLDFEQKFEFFPVTFTPRGIEDCFLKKGIFTGFSPFTDVYRFRNFGNEFSELGMCYGMVSTELLYYGFKSGKSRIISYDGEKYFAPIPVDVENPILYDNSEIISYGLINEIKKYRIDGRDLTPLDNLLLAITLHQVKRAGASLLEVLLHLSDKVISLDEALKKIEEGYPVILGLEDLKHGILAIGYIKDNNRILFAVSDPNDPQKMRWVDYNLETKKGIYLWKEGEKLKLTNVSFRLPKTLTLSDFREVWEFWKDSYPILNQTLGNYKITASNNVLTIESGNSRGYFDGFRYVSNIKCFDEYSKKYVNCTAGIMEFRKDENTNELKDVLYAIAYPVSLRVNIKTEKPSGLDPLILLSPNFNSSVIIISEESINATTFESEVEFASNGKVTVETLSFDTSRSFSIELAPESRIKVDMKKPTELNFDMNGDGVFEKTLTMPTAVIKVSALDDLVMLDASESYDDGEIVSYVWTIGEIKYEGINLTLKYAEVIGKTVTLEITDNDGAKSNVSKIIAPDLVIEKIDLGDNKIIVKIANRGNLHSKAFNLTVYVDENKFFEQRIDGLEVDESIEISVSWTPFGNRIYAFVDSGEEIPEIDEMNNILFTQFIQTTKLTISIYDENNAPVEAKIQLGEEIRFANATIFSLEEGTYDLRIEKEGYIPVFANLSIRQGESKSITVKL